MQVEHHGAHAQKAPDERSGVDGRAVECLRLEVEALEVFSYTVGSGAVRVEVGDEIAGSAGEEAGPPPQAAANNQTSDNATRQRCRAAGITGEVNARSGARTNSR